ncbi:hypothetical protein QMK34_04380 [Amycolatopsis sp. H20-H5]|nr:hypothetical protein [Amycolatopsis sp. H20-H5]MEC3974520.1 hypothetical protein [Amycolatopsis sp. H20-H5]
MSGTRQVQRDQGGKRVTVADTGSGGTWRRPPVGPATRGVRRAPATSSRSGSVAVRLRRVPVARSVGSSPSRRVSDSNRTTSPSGRVREDTKVCSSRYSISWMVRSVTSIASRSAPNTVFAAVSPISQ